MEEFFIFNLNRVERDPTVHKGRSS